MIQYVKKVYYCDWCVEKINVGDIYEWWCWFDGGDVGMVKMYLECVKVSSKVVVEEGWDFEYYLGMFWCGCGCDLFDLLCEY